MTAGRPPAKLPSLVDSPSGSGNDETDQVSRSSAGATDSFLRKVAGGDDPTSEGVGLGDEAIGGPAAARFEVRRRLGSGGFGTVYEAFDRERNARVALKTLNRQDPRALYRFKQEFRALADMLHPNLVQLYELHGDGEQWFFTMELVDGKDARSYVRPAAALSAQPRPFDELKLRALLHQLAAGLCFLHDAGKLHRDIKPSNVIVDREGRVVLLDFGLVVDLTAEGGQSVQAIAGTPHYMAPEQAVGDPIGPAADLYAVGVLLYQALTDRLPFEGSGMDIIGRKLTMEPPPPAELAAGIPDDLNQLCIDLLKRAPAARPSGREVQERLGRIADQAPSSGTSAPESIGAPEGEAQAGTLLVGRRAELEQLHEAFNTARAGRTAAALLHGRSGMGKSALMSRFIHELRRSEASPVILRGRCFEQESVPFKALDSLVDALGRYLQRLGEAEVRALLPRDAATLSRLFPALNRVPAVAAAPRRPEPADRLASRRRAFAALRELFARLGDRSPLVLFIDDLQWGDADGGALLADLLRPPDAPAMLVVFAYRSDEDDQSECLRALLPALRATAGPALELRDIEVGALSEAGARELALAELSRSGAAPPAPERAAAIALESGGWPFFIRELCLVDAAIDRSHPSLEAMLRSRIAELPGGAQRLLEVIAMAGRPIRRGAALRAAELGDEGPAVLALLRKQRLVRVRGDRTKDEVESYHDRIRETVTLGLSPEQKRTLHLGLATALLAAGPADAETLAVHLHAAGETAKAADHMLKAADQALFALGFERAARLYRQAIEAVGELDPRRRELHERLGVALGNLGRGSEAAEAYLVAAGGAAPSQALDLRRRAAEHYLISGRSDEGIAVLRAVLAATGIAMPATELGAALRLLLFLALLRLRGLGFRERAGAAAELLRIDACAAVAFGMISARPLTALYFHKRFLLLALRSGDPYRVLTALLFEAGYAAAWGGERPSRWAKKVEQATLPLIERLRDSGPRFRWLEGAIDIVGGATAMFRGHFREARQLLERGLSRSESTGIRIANELALGSTLLIGVLYCLGEWREYARRHAIFLEEARARGDLFLEIELLKAGHLAALMEDQPAEAREMLNRVEALWSRADQSRRYARMLALGETALYEESGIGESAVTLVNQAWPALARSGMLVFSSNTRAECLYLRGRAHLAAAADEASPRRAEHLRAALRDARAIGRMKINAAVPYSSSLQAGVAAARGERQRAGELLAAAEAAYTSIDMAMSAALCRRRAGELAGAASGRERIAAADAVMRAQGVRDPERMTAMYLPGRW